jgi:hypothetical protein
VEVGDRRKAREKRPEPTAAAIAGSENLLALAPPSTAVATAVAVITIIIIITGHAIVIVVVVIIIVIFAVVGLAIVASRSLHEGQHAVVGAREQLWEGLHEPRSDSGHVERAFEPEREHLEVQFDVECKLIREHAGDSGPKRRDSVKDLLERGVQRGPDDKLSAKSAPHVPENLLTQRVAGQRRRRRRR